MSHWPATPIQNFRRLPLAGFSSSPPAAHVLSVVHVPLLHSASSSQASPSELQVARGLVAPALLAAGEIRRAVAGVGALLGRVLAGEVRRVAREVARDRRLVRVVAVAAGRDRVVVRVEALKVVLQVALLNVGARNLASALSRKDSGAKPLHPWGTQPATKRFRRCARRKPRSLARPVTIPIFALTQIS